MGVCVMRKPVDGNSGAPPSTQPLAVARVFAAVLALVCSVSVLLAQEGTDLESMQPERHFRLDNPASLTDAEAEAA
jgi:hypothetical protein